MTSPLALAGWALTRPFRSDAPDLDIVSHLPARLSAAVATNRRIGVLSLDGGTGTSTVAAGVAAALSRHRPDGVLAASAHRSPRGLGWALGGADSLPRRPDRSPARADEARAWADATALGPRAVTADDTAVGEIVDIDAWWHVVEPLTRFFDVTVTDFGRRPTPDDVRRVAEVSHALCIVTAGDRHGAELAALCASLCASAGPRAATTPGEPAVVPAVVCVVDRQAARRPVAQALRSRGIRAVTVPRDRALESAPLAQAQIGLSTRLALDLVAAEALAAAGAALTPREAGAA